MAAHGSHAAGTEDGLLCEFEDISLHVGNSSHNKGVGKLTITSKQVLWQAHSTAGDRGAEAAGGETEFAVEFRQIILHAICRDVNAFPHPCIYCQLDVNNVFGEAGSEARFVPADSSSLQDLFRTFSEGAALNPDEGDGDSNADDGGVIGMGMGMGMGMGRMGRMGMGTEMGTGMEAGVAASMGMGMGTGTDTDIGIDDAGEFFTDAAQVHAALASGTAAEQEERQRCLAHLDSVLEIGGLHVDDDEHSGIDLDTAGAESASFALAERLVGTVDGQFDDATASNVSAASNAGRGGTGVGICSSADAQAQPQAQPIAPPAPPAPPRPQ